MTRPCAGSALAVMTNTSVASPASKIAFSCWVFMVEITLDRYNFQAPQGIHFLNTPMLRVDHLALSSQSSSLNWTLSDLDE